MPQPAAKTESIVGPLLVLLAGAGFSGLMAHQLWGHLHFTWRGVSTRARVQQKSPRGERQVTLQFEDENGLAHTVESEGLSLDLWEHLEEGGTLAIRYLPEDPTQARPESEMRTGWLWSALWTFLGLAVTLLGVLLMWGRRPSRPRRWPPTSGW